MDRFYDMWLSQKVSDPAAAMRATKRWFMRHPDPNVANPDNWAPFVLLEG